MGKELVPHTASEPAVVCRRFGLTKASKMAGMATRIATGTVATVVTADMPFQLYVV